MKITSISVRGTVEGSFWWPYGEPFMIDASERYSTDENAPFCRKWERSTLENIRRFKHTGWFGIASAFWEENHEEETPVIFRKYPDGDVIALFPADPGTNDPYTCSSYMHVGQHGSADPFGVMRDTAPATSEEYADLKDELESAPYHYRLKVYTRNMRHFLEMRKDALREARR